VSTTTVPLVALARTTPDELCAICHDIGFFVATDHGIDPSVTGDVFDAMRRFFALPDADKRRIDKATSPQFRGWEPVGSEYTNGRVDVREQIDLWTEWPATADRDPPYLALLGPNQWPPDDLVPGMRAAVTRWFRDLSTLADRILSMLSVGLGLSPDHLQRYFGPQPMSLVKLISYPPTPTGGAGVNAHHDTGFVTVLATGGTPGLQVETPDGTWIDVPDVPGSFVVNLGEMLQAITGNYLVATPHRVIATQPRMSAGYFHGPSLDTVLEPLPLATSFAETVAASPRHAAAGFMARRDETEAGVGDMASPTHPTTYGEQLWNYFARSYPANMARHHGQWA
jgi:isopenicillin N synthase-like dioxygenase